MPVLHAILTRFLLVLSVGAITVSVSEFWFYEVASEVSSVGILLTYGLLGYLLLVDLQRFAVGGLAGLAVSAATFGFLVEGVAVPVVYSGLPLTIVWTSLAWHALITVGTAWIGLRWLMDRSVIGASAACAAFGVFLGAWNSYLWNATETTEPGEIIFDWQPAETFVSQFLFAYLLFLCGQVLFDRLVTSQPRYGKLEHRVLWGLAGILSVTTAIGHGLLAVFPVLPALVALCLFALHRGRGDGGLWELLYDRPLPLWRFAPTALIPTCAIPCYLAIVHAQIQLEMNALVILTAGPFSVALFLWALFQMLRGPAHRGSRPADR